jgi:proline dehydrogenase
MKELGVKNDHPNVYFSQLYGMSDHITFNLADLGYNVTKYLPYGPVKSTLPYLIRRAQENTAIAGQMTRELKLILEEKERRKTAKLLVAG